MRVAIYIRVSTEEQAQEGYSISAQNQRLKAYCIAQDWTVTGFYIDEGISAKDMNRPQLQQMIKDIKSGNVDCVLVYRLDRLTRSVLDLYKLLELFEKHNCKFKSATEVYDTTTAMGRLFITIVGALAQWERENLGERVKMGYQEKVRQGKYAGVVEPFGYNLNQKEGTMTIKEDEAKTVRLIYDLYLKGLGGNRICRYLNQRNIKTRHGQWRDRAVLSILKNPLYKGTIRWGKNYENTIYVEDSVPAIVSKEIFEEVQKTIERRKHLSPKQVSSNFIFAGTLKCQKCGLMMTGHLVYHKNAKGEKVTYKSYRCKNKNFGRCEGVRSMSEIKLKKAFISYLNQFDYTPALKEVVETVPIIYNEQKDDFDVEQLEKELEQIAKRKKKWQYAWANDLISDNDFNKRMDEEKRREEEINNLLNTIEIEDEIQSSQNEIYSVLKDIKKNWEKLDDLEKKNLVQLIVQNIDYYHEGDEIRISNIDFY
ncbi:recombinase family protein [Heyndrickxia sp. FSL W8-0496]|uniref:recombinase family protein n=1 Tax=Heyndrickxia sp. FSL W8-0496 TaxID=2954702 RepID=UPI0030F79CC1